MEGSLTPVPSSLTGVRLMAAANSILILDKPHPVESASPILFSTG